MEERYNNLRFKVDELLKYKKSIEVQQIPYPVGLITKSIIRQDLLVVTGKSVPGTSTVFDVSLEVSFDGDKLLIPAVLID